MSPSFMLRKIDPEFWSRVQAKAKAENITVKALILKLLTQWLGVLVLVLLITACGSPTEPSPGKVVAARPACDLITATPTAASFTCQDENGTIRVVTCTIVENREITCSL